MTYATIMVHLGIGHSNTRVLAVAAELAIRFGARLVGIAASPPIEMIYGDGFVVGDIIDVDRDQIEKQVEAAGIEFRDAMASWAITTEWRSAITFEPPTYYLSREARSADLFVAGAEPAASLLGPPPALGIGDLVMQIGRPVLSVPAGGDMPKFERAVVCWKDTRETRRAALDALPLLKKAQHVTIVEIASEHQLPQARAHVEAVALWLKGHGIVAEAVASPSTSDDSTLLDAISVEHRVDFLVAGAYGHNRLREWVLGGVTRDLLLRPTRCALVSHQSKSPCSTW
jgi:nucleotide-binding universal stress UspA family protein